MKKYTFNQDFDANGTNVVPPGAGMANFQLKYHFKKGDTFDGEIVGGDVSPKDPTHTPTPIRLIIYTPNALNTNGSVWAGKASFVVPQNIVTGGASSLSSSTFWTPQVKVGLGLVAGVALLIVAIKFWK